MPDSIRHPGYFWIPAFAGMTTLLCPYLNKNALISKHVSIQAIPCCRRPWHHRIYGGSDESILGIDCGRYVVRLCGQNARETPLWNYLWWRMRCGLREGLFRLSGIRDSSGLFNFISPEKSLPKVNSRLLPTVFRKGEIITFRSLPMKRSDKFMAFLSISAMALWLFSRLPISTSNCEPSRSAR